MHLKKKIYNNVNHCRKRIINIFVNTFRSYDIRKKFVILKNIDLKMLRSSVVLMISKPFADVLYLIQ